MQAVQFREVGGPAVLQLIEVQCDAQETLTSPTAISPGYRLAALAGFPVAESSEAHV